MVSGPNSSSVFGPGPLNRGSIGPSSNKSEAKSSWNSLSPIAQEKLSEQGTPPAQSKQVSDEVRQKVYDAAAELMSKGTTISQALKGIDDEQKTKAKTMQGLGIALAILSNGANPPS